jgi:hypothetical protein
MNNSYTEDHLVEQPAIQLMQHELGWDVVNCYDEWSSGVSNQGRDGKREVGGNIEHRTPNIERRSEEKRKIRLNPDLPVEAIEGAVEGILNVGCWILNGRGRRQAEGGLNQNSRGGGVMSALVGGFQYFWRFHRLVKLAFLLKSHSIFTESGVSRMRESGDFVKIRPPSACAFPRVRVAGLFVRNLRGLSNVLILSEFLFKKKTSA